MQTASGLKLSGQGLKLSGQGWRSGVGGTLLAIGGVSAIGGLNEKNVDQVIGGALFSALGTGLIAWDKKRKKKGKGYHGSGILNFHPHLLKHIKKYLHKNPIHIIKKGGAYQGSGKIIATLKHAKDFYEKHKNRPISIKDMFPKTWKAKGKKLMAALKHAVAQQQKGSGIFSKIGKIAKKAISAPMHEMREFAAGRTKFKPSQYMNIAGTILNIEGKIGSAVGIPGASILGSVADTALKKYSKKLKSEGRGTALAGGAGAVLAGGRMPLHIKNFMNKYKGLTKKIAMIAKKGKGYQEGSGKFSRLLASAGLVGTAIGGTALAGYKYLLEHPEIATKIAAQGVKKALMSSMGAGYGPHGSCSGGAYHGGAHYGGRHESLPYGGIHESLPYGVLMKGGRIKKDRYSVYYGYYPKTTSGLMKRDFLLRGNKVISKKKSMMGKKMKMEGRGIFSK